MDTLWGGDVPLHPSHPDLALLSGRVLARLLNYIGAGKHGFTVPARQLERGKRERPKPGRLYTASVPCRSRCCEVSQREIEILKKGGADKFENFASD